ncbi:MAG: NAD(P)/FAD-dependent oxidoreductase [Candidatus Uhrbacteria bacterium]
MRVAIIGGGAAGMMCAARIQEMDSSMDVFLIERNNGLGKKVIISGGGRCNLTTGIHDVKTLLTKYPRGNKFLTSAMYAFPPEAVYTWFEEHGVPLKAQPDERVFPVSDDGKDVVGVFEELFKETNVNVLLGHSVTSVKKDKKRFVIEFKGKKDPLVADALVLTTGGQAYSQTGSKGDGYAFATDLGHKITPLAPSLSAFFTEEKWPADISGLSFEEADITVLGSEKANFKGPFLFTHKGISGPAVFALSSLTAFDVCTKEKPLKILINIFPNDSQEELINSLKDMISKNRNKQFTNVLGGLVPKSLAEIAVHSLGISYSRLANGVSNVELRSIVDWLMAIPLHVVQRGAGDEFVTAGGVDLSEVDPSTMESKICSNLFFAGEILNVDGFTGGFNLQASWAAGYLAGTSIGQIKKES